MQIHALTVMEAEEFFGVSLERFRLAQLEKIVLCLKIGIIRRIDGLRNTKDTVCDWETTSKFG